MPSRFTAKVPNILTIGRMLGTLLMVLYYCFFESYKFEILWTIFFISAISDFFDGYLSRKFNATSNFGKCLDPISDKLLLITAIFLLIDAKQINLFVAFALMGREIVISGLREFLALQKVELPVSRLAKWKTMFQLVGVGMCFFVKADAIIFFVLNACNGILVLMPITLLFENLEVFKNLILALAVYTTLHTGVSYLYSSSKYLKK